ncbi:hypothetical protein BAUCODRAFT_308950 [Baudoinia panamericana UAMH 10762]|uniref:Uncharacterized protein n=1 Tax=Baudoinia panamericana (strain UAMH 10762) TaxID=717646 RepID=M2M5H4_BAUPA|nr:uncharacterized protein BAUCODRAFT_308950 [Baudoinia panamericana UAMH 10762]EMC91876.1 hypothetical protein BAUCODRAFT_308950 [Baudoinia panamericana UAMH 10762]
MWDVCSYRTQREESRANQMLSVQRGLHIKTRSLMLGPLPDLRAIAPEAECSLRMSFIGLSVRRFALQSRPARSGDVPPEACSIGPACSKCCVTHHVSRTWT